MENDKIMKRGRTMYIIEAGLEYLVSLLVTGTFFAELTKALGFSDSLTGILSSVISLGCLFQMLSVFYRKRSVKTFVILLSITNQLLFLLLYVTPLCDFLPAGAKTAAFVLLILSAYLFYYIAHPKKISWLMSLVDPAQRGTFTANKEIISLAMGITFTFIMGRVVDVFKARGELRTAFAICAGVIFLLTVGHTLTLLFSAEPQSERSLIGSGTGTETKTGCFRNLLKDRTVWKLAILFSGWYLASYLSTPFYGAYQIGALGFTQTDAVILTSIGSVIRMFVERPWGRYADRHSFAAMLRLCLIVAFLSFAAAAFARPENGIVCFALYYIFRDIAYGGISSALINVVFESVPEEKRADSFAFTQALAGTVGFFATLLISPAVDAIERNGNRVFGISLYPQQFTSILSALVIAATVLYLSRVVMKIKKPEAKH